MATGSGGRKTGGDIFERHGVAARREIVLWGWADQGERVIVTFNHGTKKTKADASGKWKLVLPQMRAGGPYAMVVRGKNTITLSNILIGYRRVVCMAI